MKNNGLGKVMGILLLCLLTAMPSTAQIYRLQQLKDSALHNNIAIRNAKYGIEAAQQQRKEAFTKYFPNISGTGLWFNANKGMAQMDINLSEQVSPELAAALAQMLPPEALAALANPMSISMVIIFFFLLFNFKKFGITTICIVALGLMLPGALVGLGLMNRTLGLTSIMGVITLMGMIMRNEILIFEHANNVLKEAGVQGSSDDHNEVVKRAAYEAGKRRMVPIFLTTATTAVGVVPMIIAGSSFWMPVGVTIFAGGIGSLIMVVTMLPVIYWKVNLKSKKGKK